MIALMDVMVLFMVTVMLKPTTWNINIIHEKVLQQGLANNKCNLMSLL